MGTRVRRETGLMTRTVIEARVGIWRVAGTRTGTEARTEGRVEGRESLRTYEMIVET